MANSRQIHFLLKRFNNNQNKVQAYLKDLCSTQSVKSLSLKYGFGSTQIQRDRSNFTTRKINLNLTKAFNRNDN